MEWPFHGMVEVRAVGDSERRTAADHEEKATKSDVGHEYACIRVFVK